MGPQLILVSNVMANGPTKPPTAKHWPADPTKQTMEHRLAIGPKHNTDHRPLVQL